MPSSTSKKRKAAAAAASTTENEQKDGETKAATSKDELIANLQNRVVYLEEALTTLYASKNTSDPMDQRCIPAHGSNPRHVQEIIVGLHQLDNQPRLNTASYVNVVYEPEEKEVAMLGATVNLADSSVYPSSVFIHDRAVDFIANLWHCPEPPSSSDPILSPPAHFSGSGTVGSTEACLLAALAHKFRWRKWYAKRHGLSDEAILAVRPNVVISSLYQAAWEKLFKYFDVEPRFIKPSIEDFKILPYEIPGLCDEKTMVVVGILGNHYNGAYDPIWDMNDIVAEVNRDKGFQIGIHVDAASGGFIAPFQDGLPPFDFRLETILSISASGHKFGESICGTGWVVFRQRQDLAEHIAISVSYLGGQCDSLTLNFSRPASGCYVQMYKFLRLGMEGYRNKVANQMSVASFIRSSLRKMKRPDGKPRFELLDSETDCLPVVAARLNTADTLISYDDIDLQHALAESHWYVSGYGLTFENLAAGGRHESLFCDADIDATMFRIVVKSNVTMMLAENLVRNIAAVLPILDKHGFKSVKVSKFKELVQKALVVNRIISHKTAC